MDTIFEKAEQLAGDVQDYVNAKIDSTKLIAAEKISKLIANIITGIAVTMFFLLVVMFAAFAMAEVLNAWIGNGWAGYLIVSGFFLLVMILVWARREKLLRMPVMNAVLHELFKKDDDDEED
ncbi:MAG TPA: phage holin family protein [Chitinophagaceae bacterium]|nr:phage holin family protein [Chitinophagaceae bacterium]